MKSKEIIKLGKVETVFEIPFDFKWTFGTPLEDIKSDIEKLEGLGVTHIDIDSTIYYDCSHVTITAEQVRIETDEEFQKRIDTALRKEEVTKQIELGQLKILKEKYEK